MDESPTSSRLNKSSLLDKKVENLDHSCGLFNFRPKWLQSLARKQIFLVVFCMTSVLQGMYFTYIVSVLTTIEKLYQLPSRTTGFLISSVEIGQISGSLSLTYLGSRGGHRPRMIAAGILLFAFANLLCSSPHFFLPSDLERSALTNRQLDGNLSNKEQLIKDEFLAKDKLCSVDSLDNVLKSDRVLDSKCNDSNEQKNKNKITFFATCIFFTAAICVGFGTTAVSTLGISYIDDNVESKESPLYFAITIGIKIFGPVLGFLLGSLCTNIYINFPFENGYGLTPSHPEWIGAWWLGVFMLGTVIMFNSIFMMSFPKKLPSKVNQCTESNYEEKTYKADEQKSIEKQTESYSKMNVEKQLVNQSDQSLTTQKEESKKQSDDISFFSTIKRLLNNRILICRIASTVFHTLPVSGLYTFLPKYLEYQYRITASRASGISGIAGILVMGFGIFTSGIFMRKYNPSPRFVSSWICIATFLYVCGMVLLSFLGCPLPEISNLTTNQLNNSSNLDCSSCQCEMNQFSPVCASNSITYLSPCLAGCSQFSRTANDYNYSNCKCLPDHTTIIRNGLCDHVQCNNLIWYIIVFSSIALLHSTTEVGGMLITLRSVRPNDKTAALGLVAFISSLLGSFPCPTLYGAVIDTACIFWQKDCDTNGACRLYDSTKFRVYFHGLTAFFMFLAFLFDICVCIMSSKVSFLDEPNTTTSSESSKPIDDSLNNNNNVKEITNESTNDTNNNPNENTTTVVKLENNDGNNNNNLLIGKIANSTSTNKTLVS